MKTLFQLSVFGVVRGARHISENFFKILERPTEAHGAIVLDYARQQQLRSQKGVLANVGDLSGARMTGTGCRGEVVFSS